MKKDFLWLHIRKSAGTTVRNALQPYYLKVDRKKKPKNFIQADPREYNDILNNHRVVLGEYQFKRALFAKKYLYKDQWDSIFSFAFSREPVERCVSMFHYLFWSQSDLMHQLERLLRVSVRHKRLANTSYMFDLFLDEVEKAHNSDSIFKPINLHFTTHVAKMFDDISDENGEILINRIYKVENIPSALNEVFEVCGIEKRITTEKKKVMNKTKIRSKYSPNSIQRKRIASIFNEDFELYDKAY